MTDPTATRPVPQLGDGRFLIVNTLGDGGTATVYLAFDMAAREWVALKALQKKYIDDEEMRRRFSFEARALELLPHPNIPRLIHYAPDSRPPFLAMELARCGSAMDWVRKHGPMPPTMACDVICQVCDAVAEAHSQGMIHRDIKPHNVLLDDTGVCKLTDFGIARLNSATSLTATGSQIGTFSFMAPEQRSDTKAVDTRADIYSLGSSFYTLLTGRTSAELFVAESDDSLMNTVPEVLRPIILTATRYQPDERYASAVELRAAVLEALPNLPPPSPESPPLVPKLDVLPGGPPSRIPVSRTFPELEGLAAPRADGESSHHHTQPTGSGWSSLPYRMPNRGRGHRRVRSGELVAPAMLSPQNNASPKSLTPKPQPQAYIPAPPPLRPHDPELPSAVPFAIQATALLLALVGLMGMFVMGVLGAGALSVMLAQWAADEKATELLTTVQNQVTLLDRIKGDPTQVESAFERFREAKGEEQVKAAIAFVAALEQAEQRRVLEQAAAPEVNALRGARDAYLRARQAWASSITRFPGRIAHGWGVVRGPQ